MISHDGRPHHQVQEQTFPQDNSHQGRGVGLAQSASQPTLFGGFNSSASSLLLLLLHVLGILSFFISGPPSNSFSAKAFALISSSSHVPVFYQLFIPPPPAVPVSFRRPPTASDTLFSRDTARYRYTSSACVPLPISDGVPGHGVCLAWLADCTPAEVARPSQGAGIGLGPCYLDCTRS